MVRLPLDSSWVIFIALCIYRHIYMVVSEILTLLIYAVSMAFLPEFFGESSKGKSGSRQGS